MPARTPRMGDIEAMLADEPSDPFLRYGLAMEYVSAGDDATAADQLLALIAESSYVPAYLQAGQILSRLNRYTAACDVLKQGIVAAKQQGNSHAEGEMAGLLSSLE
jgi:predicted Zn-dependent protease